MYSAAVLAVLVGVACRLRTASPLWLDETLSVNIARLPLDEIPSALRRDGSPPLYYVLLHGWISLVGEGTVAVRLLSAVFGVACLPLAWLVARRHGGRGAAAVAVLLLATSPFAVRYSTEARMYALVMLLALLAHLCLLATWARPGRGRVLGLAVVTAALMLTHYWTLYAIGAVALGVAVRAWRRPQERPAARRIAAAVAVAVALFAAWLPAFLFQLAHTGTPWATPEGFAAVLGVVGDWAGGGRAAARVLGLLLLAGALVGYGGRRSRGRVVELDLGGVEPGRTLAAAWAGTLGLAVLAGLATGSGYAVRYTAVVLPLFLVLVAVGTQALGEAARLVAVAAMTAAGLLVSTTLVFDTGRTQAAVVARSIRAELRPGDAVVYCPDQLGPAVSRLLPRDVAQWTYPHEGRPELVDWVDYAERNRSASPTGFAASADRRAGASGRVWLVWQPGYRTFGNDCELLAEELARRRLPTTVVRSKGRYAERSNLTRYDARR